MTDFYFLHLSLSLFAVTYIVPISIFDGLPREKKESYPSVWLCILDEYV